MLVEVGDQPASAGFVLELEWEHARVDDQAVGSDEPGEPMLLEHRGGCQVGLEDTEVQRPALLREIPCRYVTGLTATPRRRDGHHPIIAMQCGPVRHTLAADPDVGSAARRVVIERRTDFDPTTLPTDPHIQEILGAISADPERTRRIADDVLAELAAGRFALVLTERRAHLDAQPPSCATRHRSS